MQWRLQRDKRHRLLKVVSVRTWYTVKGKVADPHSEPCNKTKNANHNISTQITARMQYSGSGKGQNFRGKNACSRCGRRGHTADACQCTQNAKCFKCSKTEHFSKIRMSHSANAQSRARPRVQIKSKHVVRHVSEPNSGSEEDYENEYMRTQLHMVKK